MKIEIGSIYKNKTWHYFAPSLNYFGKTFIEMLNTNFKLAVGVGDKLHPNPIPSYYILFDSKYQPRHFQKTLNWLRYQEYYLHDYVFDEELKGSRQHMIVLKVPEVYIKAYNHLLKSEFSKMYTKDQVKGLFGSQHKLQIATLLKSPNAYKHFIQKLRDEFDSDVTEKDLESKKDDIEFELPFKLEEEVFNYHKNLEQDDNRDFRKVKFW